MENIDSNGKSDHDLISIETLEDIFDGSQTLLTVNKMEARCKIRDCIRQRQSEWKVVLKATRNMGKCLHKVFSYCKVDFAGIDQFGRIWFINFTFHTRI